MIVETQRTTPHHAARPALATLSVVIPTCDRQDLLRRALRSVKGQTSQPDEIVIIDNGAQPVQVEEEFHDVKIARLPARSGVSRARNAGVDAACGIYIAFLDDDDEWDPHFLERMLAKIELCRDVDFLYGRRIILKEKERLERPLYSADELLGRAIVAQCGIGGQNLVVRRSAFLEVGGFNPALRAAEDAALIVDLLLADKIGVPVGDAVAFLHRGRSDHLTEARNLVEGQKAFARRYRNIMSAKQKIAMASRINRTRSKVYDDRPLLRWLFRQLSKNAARIAKRMLA